MHANTGGDELPYVDNNPQETIQVSNLKLSRQTFTTKYNYPGFCTILQNIGKRNIYPFLDILD